MWRDTIANILKKYGIKKMTHFKRVETYKRKHVRNDLL